MKKTILILIHLLTPLLLFARTEVCPNLAPSDIAPDVQVKVRYDNKTKNYIYQYTVTNLPEAKVPIWRFSIEADAAPVSILSPKGWETGQYDKATKEIYWTYSSTGATRAYIKPGKKLRGFEVVSKTAPGLVKAYADGDVADTPIVKFDNDEEETDPDAIACPGFYNGSGNSDYVVQATKGPAIANRVEAKIRIKKPEGRVWLGSPNLPADIEISPLDYGQLEMIVFGSKGVDVNKMDYSTIRLGPGGASYVPVKKVIINEFKDVSDNEIFQYLKNNKAQHMQLAFNLQDIEVRCNVERSLFLTAKIGAKNLLGAVNIKPVACDAKTFAREAKKDKYHKPKQ